MQSRTVTLRTYPPRLGVPLISMPLEEAETHRYLKEYDGFDARQLRKMTHLEKINGKYLLFDYRNRSRLSQNAATYEVCFSNE